MNVWEWLGDNYNQLALILGFFALISWSNFRKFICLICNGLKQLLDNIKIFVFFIFNWIREKIVGKEKLELLKELDTLKGKKKVINFLEELNQSDEHNKISRTDILLTFTNLFYREINNEDFVKKFEKDKENHKTSDDLLIGYALEKLFEKYSVNNN